MSNLTYIIILAVVIIVFSILNAFGKAVGSGANVKDFFLDESDKEKQKPNNKDQHSTPTEPPR